MAKGGDGTKASGGRAGNNEGAGGAGGGYYGGGSGTSSAGGGGGSSYPQSADIAGGSVPATVASGSRRDLRSGPLFRAGANTPPEGHVRTIHQVSR